mmetsp:Transcript_5077/g.9036  ORF Transcript_5077/g.9036 Transcript_5077/m.9036 type:complete len:91 (+) Transcript_5077:235-507(+)
MMLPRKRHEPVANPTMEKAEPLILAGMVVEIKALRLQCVIDMWRPTRKYPDIIPIVDVHVMKITFAHIRKEKPNRSKYFLPKRSAMAPMG